MLHFLYMQERVKTSFIPKASLQQKRSPRSGVTSSFSLINFIAVIILIASIVGAVGIFLFEQYTIQSIERKRESLERARAAFEPATIKELARLDTRLNTGFTLLNGHVKPSQLFDELERLTLTSVRFSNFSYGETTPGRVFITMSGEARSFNALALQSDAFGESDAFNEPLFEGLNLNELGTVVFNVTSIVDESVLSFTAPSSGGSAPQPEVTP